MPIDRNYVQENRAATERLRRLVNGLTDPQLLTPVGEYWTVAICLAHMVFWDRRVMYVMEMTRKDGKLFVPKLDIVINDLSLPLWAAIPPRAAAHLAVKTADECDKQLEAYPQDLLGLMFEHNKRLVMRSLHRGEHLNEIDAALRK
jgi:hypothetical protein